ncbi:hypothetical protein SOVF_070730 [Spinacia oleracea]|nr:hypothetical protein SOVF_070730 [Spinacia oleracea]
MFQINTSKNPEEQKTLSSTSKKCRHLDEYIASHQGKLPSIDVTLDEFSPRFISLSDHL